MATDLIWPADRAQAAETDGWQLAFTVDSGKSHAYYQPFPKGPRFPGVTQVMQHLIGHAKSGSKLHLAALHAITASRMPISQGKKP